MIVTFVLPFSGRRPGGGVKVVYEYANNLVALGHEVNIIHAAGLYLGIDRNDRWIKNIIKFLLLGLTKKYLPNKWFSLNREVSVYWAPSLLAMFIPESDVIVATAWGTAEWVARYPANRGKKFYLIQGLEDWSGDRERVLATWKLPISKVVISKWLQDIALSLGQVARYIPNGLDFDKFGIDTPPEEREPMSFLMLYHHLPLKGTKDGLKILVKIKTKFPNIKVTLFGVSNPKPGELPDWVTFEQMPSQKRLRSLYNQAAIFLSQSRSEGWALPPAEAMQCGCATVLTDIGGHEYAIHNKTSLLSAPQDVDAMVKNIELILNDNDLRIRLANAGVAEIAQYTWPRATRSLEKYFQESA